MSTGTGVAEKASQGTSVTTTQQRRGWFRLAFAAVAFAMLVMAVTQEQAGSANASARMILSPASTAPSFSLRWTSWEWPALKNATSADYGAWTAIQPVLFIGLVAPLELMGTRFIGCDSRRHASPAFPSSFQRPPPQLA